MKQFLLIILISFALTAETLTGKVIKVADGDTVTVLDGSNQTFRIRLIAIDAPESKQTALDF